MASPRIDSQRLAPRGRPATCRDLGLAAFQCELAPIRRLAVMDVHDTARTDRDPQRTERGIHHVVPDGDEPFPFRAGHEAFACFADEWFERVHRTASFTFFIASATRERAASSLQPSASATSAYDRPSTFRNTNAARWPVGSDRTAVARSRSVTPSRSGAASRRSAIGTTRRFRRTWSIALFVAIR